MLKIFTPHQTNYELTCLKQSSVATCLGLYPIMIHKDMTRLSILTYRVKPLHESDARPTLRLHLKSSGLSVDVIVISPPRPRRTNYQNIRNSLWDCMIRHSIYLNLSSTIWTPLCYVVFLEIHPPSRCKFSSLLEKVKLVQLIPSYVSFLLLKKGI